MEVHAHTHTPRKKWTHYFWEFLMLFLAVFCGFLAENFREHQVEHKRTVRYAKQFMEEIKLDTALFNQGISFTDTKNEAVDSLLLALVEKNWKQIYFWGLSIDDYYFVKFHDASFEQIKNSGSLRNFRNEQLLRAIQEYIFLRENIVIVQDGLADDYNLHLTPFINKNLDKQFLLANYKKDRHVFDSLWQFHPMPNSMLSGESNAILEFKNMLVGFRTSYDLKRWYIVLKNKSIALIKIFEKEYDLK
jgi:hypothetical protein